MEEVQYTVDPLSQLKMSWLLRQRLRSVREWRGTGLLLQGVIRTPSRSMSSKNPAVGIWEGKARLGLVMSALQIPKWVPLVPGEHMLTFVVSRAKSGSSFTATFALADGDVLVAVCEPIQPWTIFGKSPVARFCPLGRLQRLPQVRDQRLRHGDLLRLRRISASRGSATRSSLRGSV